MFKTKFWDINAIRLIVTHDGIKHWHVATKDSWFEHIAITAGKLKWLEPVDDEMYSKL